MIQSLRLQNFKAIHDVKVPLERLTIFVGPNGSGKTSFLQGLNFFTEIALRAQTQSLNYIIFSDGYLGPQPRETPMIITGAMEQGDIRLTMNHSYQEYLAISEKIPSEFSYPQILTIEARVGRASSVWEQLSDLPPWATTSGHAKFFRLEVNQMENSTGIVGDSMASDGNNLPSFLLHLQINHPEVLNLINEDLKSLIPAIKGVRVNPNRFGETMDRFKSGTTPKQKEISTTFEDLLLLLKISWLTSLVAR